MAGTPLALYGLGLLWGAAEYRFLAVTALVLFIIFVATPGRPYYIGGLYGLLAAAGAVGLQRRREAGRQRRRWLVWPAYALSTAAAGSLLVLSVTIVDSGVGEGIAQRAAYHALPPDQRERTVIMGQSYILAAYLDGYSATYQLPAAYSGNRSYGYFPPPPDSQDAVLLSAPAGASRVPRCGRGCAPSRSPDPRLGQDRAAHATGDGSGVSRKRADSCR